MEELINLSKAVSEYMRLHADKFAPYLKVVIMMDNIQILRVKKFEPTKGSD